MNLFFLENSITNIGIINISKVAKIVDVLPERAV
jgi:hypothetical protein